MVVSRINKPLAPEKIKKILVIKLGALGDFILSDSAFKAIRKHYPHAHITLLTTPAFHEFAGKLGYFDDIVVFERFSFLNFVKVKLFIRWIKQSPFDIVFDLQMVDRTQSYYYLFKLFSRQTFMWVGHVRASSYFLEDVYFKKHPRERLQRLLGKVGIMDIEALDIRRLGQEIRVDGLREKYILLVPGASLSFGGAKIWPLGEYQKLTQKLTEKGFDVVIIGGRGGDNSMLRINNHVFDLTGQTTLNQVIYLASKAYAAIGGDTGPMHMAAAARTPVFVLFSKKALPAEQVGPIAPLFEHYTVDDLKSLKVEDVWPHMQAFLR